MKIFEPNTLKDSLQPITSIYWLLGMGIIEYPIGKPRKIIGVIFSSIIYFSYGIIGCLVFTLATDNHDNIPSHFSAMKFYFTLNYYASILFATADVFASIFFNEEHINCLTKLTEIDLSMKSIGINRSYKMIFNKSIEQFIKCILLSIADCVADYIFIKNLSTNNNNNNNDYNNICITILVICFQYSAYLTIVGDVLFSTINWLMVENIKDLNASLKSMRIKYTNRCDDERTNRLIRIEAVLRDKEKFDKLRKIRNIHSRLLDVAESWYKIKAVHVVSSTVLSAWSLANISQNGFYLITDENIESFEQWRKLIILSIRLILQITKLNMIVNDSSTLASEAKRTGGILLRYLHPIPLLRTEAYDFALELNDDNRINFTAAGLFYVNKSLIGRVASIALTYFIVMIQSPNRTNVNNNYDNSSAN